MITFINRTRIKNWEFSPNNHLLNWTWMIVKTKNYGFKFYEEKYDYNIVFTHTKSGFEHEQEFFNYCENDPKLITDINKFIKVIDEIFEKNYSK